ncbi:MAG: hypothetical protein ABI626_10460 [Sphingomicrobium sp.]
MAHLHRWLRVRIERLPRWHQPALIACAAGIGLAASASIGFLVGDERGATRQLSVAWDEPSAASPVTPLSQSGGRDGEAARAFAAAFSTSDQAIESVGALHEPTRFRPGLLVPAPFGPVLLSEGQVLAPLSDSTGKLAVIYMVHSSDGLKPQARFIPALESGSMGRLSQWTVRSDFGRYPVVEVEGLENWQGLSCARTTLLELRPEGPAELVTIPTAFDNSDASRDGNPTRIEGRIRNVRADRGFDVTYSGSAGFTERFVQRGERYVIAGTGQTRMKSC